MRSTGNLAGTQTSDPFECADEATIHMDGNFGGGSVTVQFKAQDDQWHDFADDLGKQVYNSPATRILDNHRRRTIRLSAVGVTNVFFDID